MSIHDDAVDPRSRSHPDHPTLARDAWLWAVDGMCDGREDNWSADDEELGNLLEAAICNLLCDRYGHQVADDQCMKPDHRFCVWCHKGMPNQPIGKVTP